MAVMYEDLGDLDKAIKAYHDALKLASDNPDIHLSLASSFIKKNDLPSAITELKLAAQYSPEAVEPHAILALVYASQNERELATGEYEKALQNASKLEPNNIDIYKNLGLIYLQQKKLQMAEETYRLILSLSSQDAESHFYLANIYDETKKRDMAIAQLKEALALKPDYPEALNYLGYIYVEDNKHLDEAEVMIRKALELDPNRGAYIDSLGWLFFKQGKFKEALEKLKLASQLFEDPVIFDHLGDVYFKLGDKEKAMVNWEKSLQLDGAQDAVKTKLESAKSER